MCGACQDVSGGIFWFASNHVVWGGAEYLDYLKLRDLNVHTATSLRRLKEKRIRHALSLFNTLQFYARRLRQECGWGGSMGASDGGFLGVGVSETPFLVGRSPLILQKSCSL